VSLLSKKINQLEKIMEAAIGFEPMHGGFADLSLNHLGTPPALVPILIAQPDPIKYHACATPSIKSIN
jgi:hypothetical protein